MKRIFSALGLVMLAVFPAAAQSGKLSIQNMSPVAIVAVHVSPIDVNRFGPNLLQNGPVRPGGSYVFSDLQNGLYDMKLVDEKGAQCVLKDVDYYQFNIWSITENCTGFGGANN